LEVRTVGSAADDSENCRRPSRFAAPATLELKSSIRARKGSGASRWASNAFEAAAHAAIDAAQVLLLLRG
jgi:hypothetical protein